MSTSTVSDGYYAFEGLDGSGTTTQWQLLREETVKRGESWLFVKEPTDGPIGTLIRSYLRGQYRSAGPTLAQLFAADRWDQMFHPETGIQINLSHGVKVCSDRCVISSLAYQASELPFEEVLRYNQGLPLPEVVFYLDIPPSAGMRRVNARGGQKEIYEIEEHQVRISAQYSQALRWAETQGVNVIRLNGLESPISLSEKVKQELWNIR